MLEIATPLPEARRASRPRPRPKDNGSSALAHELANLIQVVSGNLELIAARSHDDATQRYLENARAAAQQLTELSRRLSALERL